MGGTAKIFTIVGAAALISGTAIGYSVFDSDPVLTDKTEIKNAQPETGVQVQQTDDGALQEASAGNGLDENAVFTYEIYNDITDMSDSVRGSCPYELIGKEMTDVKEFYPDWQVTEFSSDAVTLRKNLGMDNTDRYVVGIYEGYVAVFYENSEEGIYMLTDTPVSVLEDDKRALLEEGIYVEGRDRLNRILEDYTS